MIHKYLLKRALDERLNDVRKHAFVALPPKTGQQASGPGGQPVDPGAAAAAGDPAAGGAAGGAPMDPAAGGAAPGGAPMDPMAAGGAPPAPPADPAADPAAAAGAPPMDPAALAGAMPPAGGASPLQSGGPDPVVPVSAMKDFAVSLIEAVKGKRTADALPPEAKAKAEGGADPSQPGPVTGLPGDMSSIMGGGPLKMASVLARSLKIAGEYGGPTNSQAPVDPAYAAKVEAKNNLPKPVGAATKAIGRGIGAPRPAGPATAAPKAVGRVATPPPPLY